MKKTTNSIKKNFIVLLSTLGCLLIADTLFAGEPGEQAPENIDNRYDVPTTAATTSAQTTTGSGITVNRAAKEVVPALQDNAITADPVTGLFQDSTEKQAPSGSASAPTGKSRGVRIVFGSDLVSSYIWRGFYNAGASIQPTLAMKVGGFSLTAWGSVDFASSSYKEADLTAAYTIGGLTVSLTDYYWTGSPMAVTPDSPGPSRNYFRFGSDTPHRVELGAAYCFGERFPLTVAWYTMLFGADKKSNGDQCYSTYAEVSYPFSVGSVDMGACVGFTPWETSGTYGTDEFAVCNVALSATKAIRFSDRFQLPVFTRLIWNPAMDDVHFVGGLSIML